MKITIEIDQAETEALLGRAGRFVNDTASNLFAALKDLTRREKETVEDDLDEDPDYALFQQGLAALDWCGGSGAFCAGGYARAGWERLCVPLHDKLCRRIDCDLPSPADVPLLHELAQALTWCGLASDDFNPGGALRGGWDLQIPPFIEKLAERLATTRDNVRRTVAERWSEFTPTGSGG